MSRTVTGTSTLGVDLSLSVDNPVLVDAAGTIDTAGSYAIFGEPGISWTLTNQGLLSATQYGVEINGAASTVVNSGQILATGTKGTGVLLNNGGSVDNTGSISGDYYGARVTGAAGVVTNAGTIGSTYAGGTGVSLRQGGTVYNAIAADITAAYAGVVINGASGTVTNDGIITASATNASGVYLAHGGSVINNATGTISGQAWGVFFDAPGTTGIPFALTNHGLIAGVADDAVVLGFGGTVTNAPGGTIVGGRDGIYSKFRAASTITNYGSIGATKSDSTGLYAADGAVITNNASASISGGRFGILITTLYGAPMNGGTVTNLAGATISATGVGLEIVNNAGTVLNAGTIRSVNTAAVVFAAGYTNLLTVDPGAVFIGTVDGGNTIGAGSVTTLELGSAASTGTIAGIGTQFVNFGSIVFDTGAHWKVAGAAAGLGGTISGFAQGDTIELSGVTETSLSYAGEILTINPGPGAITLDLPGAFTTASFAAVNTLDGVDITVVCFAAGTRIATLDGPVAIERLRAGDRVRTLREGSAEVTWVGHRRVDCARHPDPRKVLPVRIAAGGFADGIPHRDLWLSPDHAVFADGVLIPIKHLINGTTIARVAVGEVTYYHVELARHDVLLAEGLPAESYLDTGNRGFFANSGGATALHPEMQAPARWGDDAAAPLATDEARVRPVWQRLATRARALGWPVPELTLTGDPAVHLRVDGRAVRPVLTEPGRCVFVLPKHEGPIRLVSRFLYPTDQRPWADDWRRLGLYVARMVWHDQDGKREMPVDHPSLDEGWWAVEGAGPLLRRWTDGDALLPVPAGATLVEVEFADGMAYRAGPSVPEELPGRNAPVADGIGKACAA